MVLRPAPNYFFFTLLVFGVSCYQRLPVGDQGFCRHGLVVGCGSLHRPAAAKGLVEVLRGLLLVRSDLHSNGSCLGAVRCSGCQYQLCL